MALLGARGLVKSYSRRRVVDGVDFEVHPGEIVGLLGPNGAGKTTTFRMACGMIDADAGTGGGPAKYGTRRRRVTHAAKFDGLPVFSSDGGRMMWTSQRGAGGSSQVWIADFVMALDRSDDSAPDRSAEPSGARPERLQVKDPETGLIYLYDTATHELSAYDVETHQVRALADKAEIEKATQLFREASKGE